MKRQAIYSMLTAGCAVILSAHAHAQTGEVTVPEKKIRRLLSKEGKENPAIRFAPVNRAQPPSVDPQRERSVSSRNELRGLIFENYTPPAADGPALRRAAAPQQLKKASAEKLPSDSEAEAVDTSKPDLPSVQVPTQGGVKEEEQ